MRQTDPITIDDVAREAGVSRITVARALISNPGLVAKKTRKKIEIVADMLGYVPNLAASTLSGQKSGTVAAIVSTLEDEYFTILMRSLQKVLADKGLQLFFSDMDYNHETEAEILRKILGRQPDGLIISSGSHGAGTLRLLEQVTIPVIEIWDLPANPVQSAIGFENYEGGALMARHLIARGYTRPLFIARTKNLNKGLTEARARDRWHGLRDTYEKEAGREVRLFLSDQAGTYDGGARVLGEIVNSRRKFDALFFVYDIWAIGALFECQRRNINLPDDVAICGFGDIPIASAVNPRLTTVHVGIDHMGRLAGEQMVDRILHNIHPPEKTRIPLSIIEGKTTRRRI